MQIQNKFRYLPQQTTETMTTKTLSLRQKINRFTKTMNELGAVDFYIGKYDHKSYLTRFHTNIWYDEKNVSLIKKWICSKQEYLKREGIGVCDYRYLDKENNLLYDLYYHNGYMFLSIELL